MPSGPPPHLALPRFPLLLTTVRHKIDHEAVTDPALKRAIFGDYTDPLTKPTTKLAEVRAAFRLRDQATRTLPSDPARALNFFVLNKMKAPADDDEVFVHLQNRVYFYFFDEAETLGGISGEPPKSPRNQPYRYPLKSWRGERRIHANPAFHSAYQVLIEEKREPDSFSCRFSAVRTAREKHASSRACAFLRQRAPAAFLY